MPELPEVRAHAERLDKAFAGVPLEKFTALSFHALKTFDPSPEAAIGRPLTAVRATPGVSGVRSGAATSSERA